MALNQPSKDLSGGNSTNPKELSVEEVVKVEFVDIAVGDKFSTIEEFLTKMTQVQLDTNVQLWSRDSRTLEGAGRRYPRAVEGANPKLKYYSLYMACVCGGRKQQGKANKRKVSSLRQDCEAGIRVGLTKDKQCLTITAINDCHNHEVSKEIYDHLPRQRQLDEQTIVDVEQALKLKANKKLLKVHIQEQTGKHVTLRDISNMDAKLKRNNDHDQSDLVKTIQRLKDINGSIVEVISQNDQFVGLFYQDSRMCTMYEKFPELVMIDATYKLTELRTPLFVLLVVDGCGNSEIVAIYLTAEESGFSLQSLAEVFKKHNPSWNMTKVILTDKDMTERTEFSKAFPGAVMQLCLFHTLRTFKREFSHDKMGISSGQRELLLELLTDMTYAKSEADYEIAYKSFKETNIKPAIEYFDKNWHPIRKEWVCYAKADVFCLGEMTNNRLESINGKLKSVCSKYATFSRFFDEFFAVLSVLRDERTHIVVMSKIKKPTRQSYSELSVSEMQYAHLVTPYAFDLIATQALLKSKVTLNDGVVHSSEGTLYVNENTCQCSFWKMFTLPCRHILAFRQAEEFDAFDGSLAAKRWTLNYNVSAHPVPSNPATVTHSPSTAQLASKKLSANQKYRKALKLCQELASLASEVGMDEFCDRLDTLNQIKQTWIGGSVNDGMQGTSSTNVEDDATDGCHDEAVIVTPEANSGVNHGHEEDGQDDEASTGRREDGVMSSISSGLEESNLCDVQEANMESITTLSNITLPPKRQKRGRPKGSETTAIGLPRCKKKLTKLKGPVAFIKKQAREKERTLLNWFVEPDVANAAITYGTLIKEQDIETVPNKITASCLDENVCLERCKKYFTSDGWQVVENVVSVKRSNPVYNCGKCNKRIQDELDCSIQCDGCLIWYHFDCLKMTRAPKSKHWFCYSCHQFAVPLL